MKIAVTSIAFSKNDFLVKAVKKLSSNVVLNTDSKRFNKTELIEYLRDAEAIIVGLDIIDDSILKECKKLKIIAKYGVGLDNIDLEACKKHDVIVGWTGGVNRLSVAEMTLGFMLGLSRNLYKTSLQLSQGTWNKSGGRQLSNQTIGIIGVGNIGKEVIRLLQPFSCNILVNDILEQKDYYDSNNLIEATKEEIFKKSDIITIHTPLTKDTKNLINKEVFKSMRSNAYVINTARGGIINQNDLKYALENKIILGAAMDVYESEPPEDKELLSLDNFYCTPHIGGNSEEAVIAMGESAINHIEKYLNKDLN